MGAFVMRLSCEECSQGDFVRCGAGALLCVYCYFFFNVMNEGVASFLIVDLRCKYSVAFPTLLQFRVDFALCTPSPASLFFPGFAVPPLLLITLNTAKCWESVV